LRKMAKRGAPKGNQNARKHGFYSRALTEAEKVDFEEASLIEGIDQEIAFLRLKLMELAEREPDRVDLHLEAANVHKVLTDIAVPLGIGIGIGAARK